MDKEHSKINLAIFSPKQNTYSETFIQAHKQLPFSIRFYYGGFLPTQLEGKKSLYNFSLEEKFQIRFNRKFSLSEHALYFSLKKEKIDCVLAEYAPTACESLNVLKKLNIPLVVHFHGFDATNLEEIKEYLPLYPAMFQYASGIITVSGKMKDDVINLGCSPDKITVSPCGPNIAFLKNTPQYKTDQFITVSRFADIKGLVFTIMAFAKVLTSHSLAKLVLVGDGPTLHSCKQLVHALKISDKVEFKGVLEREEILLLMQNSLAFLQHSITFKGITEGSPVSIMEAMGASLPVISTKSGGIPELVSDKLTGFLIEEYDVDSMANYMRILLDDKELAGELGKAAKEIIQEKFSINIHLKKISDQISKAVSKKNEA